MDEIKYFKKKFWYEEKIDNEKSKIKKMCKCGHRVIVPAYTEKVKCSWCGCWVFKNKQEEFNYKLKIALRKNKHEQISQ